jgi:DNA-binding GntR family transcriptional regulator
MSASKPGEQKSQSLAEQAYDLLESRLVTLELAPGSVVSEGLLIDMVGLGRTPVREAMQRFAHQDLIRVLPRRGLMIVPIERDDMLQVLEVRKRLERLLVRLAALNARDEQRSSLSAIARELSTAHDSFEKFLELDHRTDRLLDECAGNPFASAAVSPLRTHCRRFWYSCRRRLRLSDAIVAHSTMIRLIARRDYRGAQKASDGMIKVIQRLVSEFES